MLRVYFLVIFNVLLLTVGSSQSKLINQGNQALREGDAALAETLYQEAEDKCKETEALANNRSVILALDGDPSSAIEALGAGNNLPHHNYNRAIYLLQSDDHDQALELLNELEAYGYKNGLNEKRQALNLTSKAEDLKLGIILSQIDDEVDQGEIKSALAILEKALLLKPTDSHLLFKQAELAMQIPNPFLTLESIGKINSQVVNSEQRQEMSLLKAQALGRMNKIREGIILLERLYLIQKNSDARLREMLAYFYLKVGRYQEAMSCINAYGQNSANGYLIAANAAHRNASYYKAQALYKKAQAIDKVNLNVQLGLAICLLRLDKQRRARALVDSLSHSHADNPNVMNAKGIIYKDSGLSYLNNWDKAQSKSYLTAAVNYFESAAELRPLNKDAYLGNKALALFYLDMKKEAYKIWSKKSGLTSQNNLALLEVSQSKYTQAYNRLDSLVTEHSRRSNKEHSILNHNRREARNRKRISLSLIHI